jgi:hypothetical protein
MSPNILRISIPVLEPDDYSEIPFTCQNAMEADYYIYSLVACGNTPPLPLTPTVRIGDVLPERKFGWGTGKCYGPKMHPNAV